MASVGLTNCYLIKLLTISVNPFVSGGAGTLDLYNLRSMTSLNATGVGLSNITNFGACAKLAVVSVNNNGLSGAIPDFRLNTGLRQFTAYGNNYTGITQNYWGANAGAMQNFLIYNNPNLSGTLPVGITGLTGIQSFSVNGCKLSGNLVLPRSRVMTVYNAYSNNFTGTIPDISYQTGLKTFGLNNNNLTGFNGGFPTGVSGLNAQFSANKLSFSGVSQILQAAVNSTSTTGVLALGGTNNARATGTTNVNNINTLVSRGWTVTYN